MFSVLDCDGFNNVAQKACFSEATGEDRVISNLFFAAIKPPAVPSCVGPVLVGVQALSNGETVCVEHSSLRRTVIDRARQELQFDDESEQSDKGGDEAFATLRQSEVDFLLAGESLEHRGGDGG